MILDKLYNKTSILATSIAVTLANWQLCLFIKAPGPIYHKYYNGVIQ